MEEPKNKKTSATVVGGGQGRTGDGHSRDASRQATHSLTTREVTRIFEKADVPRSQRSIERYCKSGYLDAILDPDEKAYYITETSIERLIGQLKDIQTGRRQSTTWPDGRRDHGGQRPTEPPTVSEDDAARIKKLEDENFNLRVDAQAKGQVITQMRDQFKSFLDTVKGQAKQIGKLETKVRALMAPKEKPEEQVRDVEATEGATVVEPIGDIRQHSEGYRKPSETSGKEEGGGSI